MASKKESLALQEEQATISQEVLYIVTLDGKYTRALTFLRVCGSLNDYRHSSKRHGKTAPSSKPDVQSSKKVP